MWIVDVADAQADLDRLVDIVASGEVITLARRGTPVARLIPVSPPPRPESERPLGVLGRDLLGEPLEEQDDADTATRATDIDERNP